MYGEEGQNDEWSNEITEEQRQMQVWAKELDKAKIEGRS